MPSRPTSTPPATLGAMIEESAHRFGDRLAIVDGAVRLSYSELAEQARTLARALMAVGVQRGDRVAIWLPNTYHWVVAALATQRVGASVVPLNTRFSGREAIIVLARAQVSVVFLPDEFLGNDYLATLRAAAGGATSDAVAVDLAGLRLAVSVPISGVPRERDPAVLSWDELLARASLTEVDAADARLAQVDAEDVADIFFTSGTTGRPKGAMTAHRQTLAVADAWSREAGLRAGDVFMIIAPFFHSFGYKAGWVVSLLCGATILPQQTFDVDTALATIEREGVCILPGPPTIFQMLLAHPRRDEHDLSSLRVAVTGSAMVPVSLVERMRDELAFKVVITAYGLTEAVVATMCSATDRPETVSTTSGRAVAEFEVRIADPAGHVLDDYEDGEIQLRGPNVMLGYLDEPEATAAAFTDDGWLRTGDAGHRNAEGYVTITDRLKDMITVGGFNVYPAEIENVLLVHPEVLDCAVVGRPDERLGEVAVAYVVRSESPEAVAEVELIDYCRAELANYKVPREVRFIKSLPRNAAGKVLKRELRERGS